MGVCLGDGGDAPALTPQNEAIVKVKTQNALPRWREGVRSRWKNFQPAELLRRHHFVLLNCRNFLKTGQTAKAGSLRLAGAAAGNGHESGGGGGQGEENAGHGMRTGDFFGKLVKAAMPLFRRSHVSGSRRSRSRLAGAAGGGGQRASRNGGQRGDFHEFHEGNRWLVFIGSSGHTERWAKA